jgi:hypothetical protein
MYLLTILVFGTKSQQKPISLLQNLHGLMSLTKMDFLTLLNGTMMWAAMAGATMNYNIILKKP